MSVRIQEIMTKSVMVMESGTSLAEAIREMNERHVSCFPVVAGDKPIGVVSERDVVRAAAAQLEGSPLPNTVCDLMSSPAVTIQASSTVDRAIDVIQSHAIRRLVVVDGNGLLAGLVTLSDLVSAQALVVKEERDHLETRVAERTEELRNAMDRMEHMSLVDPMLGTGNRRAMDLELNRLQAVAKLGGGAYSVLLLDLDDFKKFNDFYGHPAGDSVLCDIAGVVEEQLGKIGMLYRYGGEEFLVSLPFHGTEEAMMVAEKLRMAAEALGIVHEKSEHAVVTLSIGVATEEDPDDSGDWRGVVKLADASLYRSKQDGRNRVSA